MIRGEIWWASLPPPAGSGPGGRRPVIVVQSDRFNLSKINTVVVAILTSNLKLADAPGNVLLTQMASGLERDSVVNVSQIYTIDRSLLTDYVKTISPKNFGKVESGIKLVLGFE